MKRICLVIAVSFSFIASYAQCDQLLKDAREFKKNGDYERAAVYYEKLNTQCPSYMDQNEKKEWEACKSKQNKTSQKKPSGGYVSQKQYETDCIAYYGTYYGSIPVMEFDAEGNCENPNVRVTCPCDSWFVTVNDKDREWLSAEQYQNSFVVRCGSNQNRMERDGSINIIVNTNHGSSKIDIINVKQEAKGTSSGATKRKKSPAQSNSSDSMDDYQSITVKVTFQKGKAVPTFENVGKLLGFLEDDKNLGLQIELPWCSEQKSEIYITNKYSMSLMKKRIKNITNYFVNSGIAKERIAWSINESNTDCDSGYVKLKDLNGESSK